MNAFLVIVLEDKDKISSHDWSNVCSEIFSPLYHIFKNNNNAKIRKCIIITIIIITIIGAMTPSSLHWQHHHCIGNIIIATTTSSLQWHNFFDISVFEEEEDWSKLPFLYQSWEAPNFGPRRPFEVFKKRKMIRIEFPKFLAWFQTPQTKHKYTNTQIRKDKYTITRITPFWNAFSVQWSVLFSKTIQYKRRQKQHRTTLIFFNKKNKAYI